MFLKHFTIVNYLLQSLYNEKTLSGDFRSLLPFTATIGAVQSAANKQFGARRNLGMQSVNIQRAISKRHRGVRPLDSRHCDRYRLFQEPQSATASRLTPTVARLKIKAQTHSDDEFICVRFVHSHKLIHKHRLRFSLIIDISFTYKFLFSEVQLEEEVQSYIWGQLELNNGPFS